MIIPNILWKTIFEITSQPLITIGNQLVVSTPLKNGKDYPIYYGK